MTSFVQAAFVADDLSRVEGRFTPAGRLGDAAVEAATAEVLGELGCRVVCVCDLDVWTTGIGAGGA